MLGILLHLHLDSGHSRSAGGTRCLFAQCQTRINSFWNKYLKDRLCGHLLRLGLPHLPSHVLLQVQTATRLEDRGSGCCLRGWQLRNSLRAFHHVHRDHSLHCTVDTRSSWFLLTWNSHPRSASIPLSTLRDQQLHFGTFRCTCLLPLLGGLLPHRDQQFFGDWNCCKLVLQTRFSLWRDLRAIPLETYGISMFRIILQGIDRLHQVFVRAFDS